MAEFQHKPSVDEAAPHKERRTRGRVVPFRPDLTTTHAASPARILQESLMQRAQTELYIDNPTARKIALLRFIGAGLLLWGTMIGAIAVLMNAAS